MADQPLSAYETRSLLILRSHLQSWIDRRRGRVLVDGRRSRPPRPSGAPASRRAGITVCLGFRPHSHHHAMMEQVRRSHGKAGAGVLDLGSAMLCMFETSWGDGAFPVIRYVDAEDHLINPNEQSRRDVGRCAAGSAAGHSCFCLAAIFSGESGFGSPVSHIPNRARRTSARELWEDARRGHRAQKRLVERFGRSPPGTLNTLLFMECD
jgi:hypothetical protein